MKEPWEGREGRFLCAVQRVWEARELAVQPQQVRTRADTSSGVQLPELPSLPILETRGKGSRKWAIHPRFYLCLKHTHTHTPLRKTEDAAALLQETERAVLLGEAQRGGQGGGNADERGVDV